MALVSCEECGNQVSSRAAACPKCGCPIDIVQATEVVNTAEVVNATPVIQAADVTATPASKTNTAEISKKKPQGYSAVWIVGWFFVTLFMWAIIPRVSMFLGLAAMFVAAFALPKLCSGKVLFAAKLQTMCCEALGCRRHFGVFSTLRAMFVGFWALLITVGSYGLLDEEARQKAEVKAATEQVAGLIESAEADFTDGRFADSREKLDLALSVPAAKKTADLASLEVKVATNESRNLYKKGLDLLKQGKLDAADKTISEAIEIPHANNTDEARATAFAISLVDDKQQIKQIVSKLNKDEFEAVVSTKQLPKKYMLGIEKFDASTNKLIAEILPEARAERLRVENDRKKRAEEQRLKEVARKKKLKKAADEREARRKIAAEKQRLADEAAARKAANEINLKGLVLYIDSQQSIQNRIIGKVENRTGRKLRYVEISYNLYDSSGAHVGTALANTTGLEIGLIWKFEASTFGHKFSTYRISELKGY